MPAAAMLPHQALGACLDVALVLSIDSSASVSAEEFNLQKNGLAAAFRDPAVQDAISAAGEVAVAAMFWGSEGLDKPQTGWVLLNGKTEVESFARMVESMPRRVTGDTGLGSGLLAALAKFETLDVCANRRVINLSGDGEQTRFFRHARKSPPPVQVKDLADTRQVEINALAISDEEKDLADYYSKNVITGPDAFVMDISTYTDLAQALRRKLIREIGPRLLSEGPNSALNTGAAPDRLN